MTNFTILLICFLLGAVLRKLRMVRMARMLRMVSVKKIEVILHAMLKFDRDTEIVRSFWLIRCFIFS